MRGKRGNARSDAPTIKTVCEHFFRTGFCEIRRCKHEHIGETIEHLRNVPPAPESSDGCLPLVSKPLRRCDGGRVQVYEPAIRRTIFLPSPLRFVAWGNKLVFDAANPDVFAEYCRCGNFDIDPSRHPIAARMTPPYAPLHLPWRCALCCGGHADCVLVGDPLAIQCAVSQFRDCRAADAGTNKSLRRQHFEQQRWTVKLHPRLSPQFRLAVRTVLLSAARFAWRTAAPADASPDIVALAAGPVDATADDTSSDSSSSDSGSDSPDSDAEDKHAAGPAAVAPAPSPAPEVRVVRLRLEAEIWHRILSFLARGAWPDLPSVGRTRKISHTKDGHHQNQPG